MIAIQSIGLDLAKKGHRWLEKVNAEKKLALPFYFLACLQNRERAPNRG
ncbi:MAG: hypothetical protein IJ892_03835 [Prevotella sp.]|nr:hypothetical protein [Prevotella sp.]